MLFPTLEFAVFFVIVFTVNWLVRPQHPVPWRVAMVAASFFFYVWAEWESWGQWPDLRLGLLLAGSIVVNHWFGNGVHRAMPHGERTVEAKWWVRAAVATNLAVLGVFKYYGFFSVQITNWLRDLGLDPAIPLVEITLPVGISFFTFQAMSYVIDIGRGQIEPMALLDFAVYLSFFPQLVAGPIVRATEFAPQLRARPDPRFVPSSEAFRLIFAGLFKKVVISSYLAETIVDDVFANPEGHNAAEVIIGVYAYAIQIYADFSGYTDIAIGVALLLGFRFPQNFDAPYRSLSIQDFWRRWHMTLSRWLRDYLYIALGGNRRGTLITYRNLMLTMVLGGLWHGAAWNFVIWGVIHGGMLAGERIVRERWEASGASVDVPPEGRAVLKWLYTFHVVCLAWVFFRAESFDRALDVLGRLGDWGPGAGVITPLLLVVIALSIASQFVPTDWVERAQTEFAKVGWAVQGAALGVGILVVDTLGPEGVAPFIYFRF